MLHLITDERKKKIIYTISNMLPKFSQCIDSNTINIIDGMCHISSNSNDLKYFEFSILLKEDNNIDYFETSFKFSQNFNKDSNTTIINSSSRISRLREHQDFDFMDEDIKNEFKPFLSLFFNI